MNKTILKISKYIISVLVILLLLAAVQRLLVPKHVTDIIEGSMIEEYYASEKQHDVIFLGDCEVYENISPCSLWQQYGISSYVRGSAQQLAWQSYYLLEDTLRYEKPQAVVFNVMALIRAKTESEAYNRMTLDGMRWSMSKVHSIQASMRSDESFIEYVFPLLRYHSRFSELTEEDFKYFFHKDKISYEGYYMRVDVKPAGTFPEPRVLSSYELDEFPMSYLDRMRELCEANNIELILMKAPSLYPHWYEEWENQILDYAKQHNLCYYNFLAEANTIGLDFSTDTYDAGLHLNLSGAEKLATYFGKILQEEHHIPDRRNDKIYVDTWEKNVAFYEQGIKERKEKLQ